jgi:hypothetical protein
MTNLYPPFTATGDALGERQRTVRRRVVDADGTNLPLQSPVRTAVGRVHDGEKLAGFPVAQ